MKNVMSTKQKCFEKKILKKTIYEEQVAEDLINAMVEEFFGSIVWTPNMFEAYKKINPDGKTLIPSTVANKQLQYLQICAAPDDIITPTVYEEICLEYIVNRHKFHKKWEDVVVPLKLPKELHNFGSKFKCAVNFEEIYCVFTECLIFINEVK